MSDKFCIKCNHLCHCIEADHSDCKCENCDCKEPEGKKNIEEKILDHCATHSRYKKSCPACKQVIGVM